MLDTSFFNMLILIFKIFFYSAGMEKAEIDLLEDNLYRMSFKYEQVAYEYEGAYGLTITPVIDGRENTEEAFLVETIDNALYQVFLADGTEFVVDMVPWYSTMDWDGVMTDNIVIPGTSGEDYALFQGADNIYLSDPSGRTLVLSRNYVPR